MNTIEEFSQLTRRANSEWKFYFATQTTTAETWATLAGFFQTLTLPM
jgi:hypothetical protein